MKKVKAGKVPGSAVVLTYDDTVALTALQVLQDASKAANRPFTIHTGEYQDGADRKIDIPYINGRALARKVRDRWEDVKWDTPVKNGDRVLIIPKVQGNQISVQVVENGTSPEEVFIHDQEDEDYEKGQGTVQEALYAADKTLAYNQSIEVNGEPADLDAALEEGDIVTIVTNQTETVPDVAGTDPGTLQTEAEKNLQEAQALQQKASELTATAFAQKQKSATISRLKSQYESAKQGLEKFGVLSPPAEKQTKNYFSSMKEKDIAKLFKAKFNVSVPKGAKKNFLVDMLYNNQ